MWIIICYKDTLLVCISQPCLTTTFFLYLKTLLIKVLSRNMFGEKNKVKYFYKKKNQMFWKFISAKKLLTLSQRQFLLLPSYVSAHLMFCFKGASQALAIPAARRTEKGIRRSVLQVINPRACTLLLRAASWILLRRMSSSKEALLRFSSVKGHYLTPKPGHTSQTPYSRFGRNLVKRPTSHPLSPTSVFLSCKWTKKASKKIV